MAQVSTHDTAENVYDRTGTQTMPGAGTVPPPFTYEADLANSTGTLPIANGGTNATTAAGARTNLGLVIGTNVLAPTGSGASLTALNATQLATGTVPVARLPLAAAGAVGAVLKAAAITTLATDGVSASLLYTQADLQAAMNKLDSFITKAQAAGLIA